jgi:hypothetical protein
MAAGDGDIWNTMLESLAHGQDMAGVLLQFFKTTEARLMCAMSVVYQEDGPRDDPDGGEDIPEESVAA